MRTMTSRSKNGVKRDDMLTIILQSQKYTPTTSHTPSDNDVNAHNTPVDHVSRRNKKYIDIDTTGPGSNFSSKIAVIVLGVSVACALVTLAVVLVAGFILKRKDKTTAAHSQELPPPVANAKGKNYCQTTRDTDVIYALPIKKGTVNTSSKAEHYNGTSPDEETATSANNVSGLDEQAEVAPQIKKSATLKASEIKPFDKTEHYYSLSPGEENGDSVTSSTNDLQRSEVTEMEEEAIYVTMNPQLANRESTSS